MAFRLFSRTFSIKKNEITLIKEILTKKPVGSSKTIQGWATSVRKMGKILFIDLNDGSCVTHLQVVTLKNKLKTPVENGSSLSVKGTVQQTEKGQLELQADEIFVVGHFDVNFKFPFNLKDKHSYDHYREFLHFRPKIKYFTSLMRFRSKAALKIHQYFNDNDFTLIHTPILTSGDCEGAAETFIVKPESQDLINVMKKENTPDDIAFFNSTAYLTVSGQLHLEATIRSLSRVYSFNPSFRAENSVSRLHLSEFYMVEAEEAFVSDLENILHRIEDCIKQLMSHLLNNYSDEIEYMLKHNETHLKEHIKMLETAINQPFSVMSFFEAKELINKNLEKFPKSKITPFNFTKAEEHFLVKHNNNMPVFIVDWPRKEKPFYMKAFCDDKEMVKAVDLLVPNVGELCGGSLREDDYEILKQKLTDMKILDNMQWYLDLRKIGNVPSGGFGMGFERFIQYFLNIQSIKDALPFPRWPHHLQM